jgi:hypothetical protein
MSALACEKRVFAAWFLSNLPSLQKANYNPRQRGGDEVEADIIIPKSHAVLLKSLHELLCFCKRKRRVLCAQKHRITEIRTNLQGSARPGAKGWPSFLSALAMEYQTKDHPAAYLIVFPARPFVGHLSTVWSCLLGALTKPMKTVDERKYEALQSPDLRVRTVAQDRRPA